MAVIRGEGGVLGLYKGTASTLLREIPGNAAMFGAYEVVKQWMARQQVCSGVHNFLSTAVVLQIVLHMPGPSFV